jgi:hypothetical protein
VQDARVFAAVTPPMLFAGIRKRQAAPGAASQGRAPTTSHHYMSDGRLTRHWSDIVDAANLQIFNKRVQG